MTLLESQFLKKLMLLVIMFTLLGLGANAQNASLHFDGAIGNYDYITVPDDNSLDFTNSFTLEAWINFDQITVSTPGYGWRSLFGKSQYNNAYGLMIYAPAGGGRVVRFYHEGLSAAFSDYVWSTIDPNTWYHIAVTYDGSQTVIYIDGVQVATNAVTGNVTQNASNLNIGFSQLGAYPWDGMMDEVRAWNIARTETEINSTKGVELTGSESGLVLYYNFNEGSPGNDNTGVPSVTDNSSSGNDGVFVGFGLTGTAGNYAQDFGTPSAADFELIGIVNESIVINTSDLSYSDLQSDPLVHIQIASLPTSGTLYLDANGDNQYTLGEEVAAADMIGLADLDAGNLQYVNSNSVSTSFTFNVNDGTINSSNFTATLVTSNSIFFDDLGFTDDQDLALSNTFTNNGRSFILAQSIPQSYTMTYQNAGTDYAASGYVMLSNPAPIVGQMGFDLSTEDGGNVTFESIDLIINGGTNQGFNLIAYSDGVQIGTQAIAASTSLTQTVTFTSDFECADRIEILVSDISGTYDIGIDNIVWKENAAPQFTHGLTEVAIDENSEFGTEVITLSGSDSDGDVLTYSITSGNDNGAFDINSSTGRITVDDETLLDFETTTSFNLNVALSDGCTTVTESLTINLNDLSPNDFCTNAITITAGTTIDGSTADATGDAAIAPNCGSNPVEADLSVGVWYHFAGTGEKITVSTCDNADYDTAIGVYRGSCSTGLTCVAGNDDGSDCSGNTSIVSFISEVDQDYYILVDGYEEDFGSFSLTTTAEPAPTPPANDDCSGAEVLTVFEEGTGTPTNGDNTTATTFTEVVFCDEYGTINDVWYTFNSGANVEVSIDIQLVDTDDAGPLNVADYISFEAYETCGGEQLDYCGSDGSNSFEVTPNTDYYLQLWNDEVSTGTFTIQINDGPNTAATVTSSTISLSRYASNADLVETVNASDSEGHSQVYSITDGNGEGIFTIDAVSGELTIADANALSTSSTSQFILTVQAADQGPGSLSSTGTITIDIIDNEFPSISSAEIAIDENSSNGSSVMTVTASDGDGDNISFSILSGNTGNAFAISMLGEITVNDETILDFESNPTFDLEIQVTDDGPLTLSSTAIVTVNLNDINELPIVDALVSNISQNNSNGYLVNTMVFTDPDANQNHTFSISAGNTNSIFSIDANTGEVIIVNDTDLMANGATTYNLEIEVADDGAPVNVGTGSLTINVFANNAPIITQETFMLDENTANGLSVANVSANDSDGDAISFSIVSGNDLGAFSITTGGEIQVANVNILDFETNPSFELLIQAQDDGAGSLASTELITIQLRDLNEMPTLSDSEFSISSSSTNGTEIGILEGVDPEDDVLSYAIVAGDDNGVFTIGTSSGIVSLVDNSQLNPAVTPQYNLTVEMNDGSLTGTTDVTINIFGNPFPTLDLTSFDMDENSAASYVIGTLTSSDVDGIQSYEIVAGNDGDLISLDATSGILTVVDDSYFNYESVQSLEIEVRLTDNGLGNIQNTEAVTILLNDVNEFSPVVNSTVNSVDENATSGTVATVNATDDDTFQTLTYTIVSGNTDNAFEIDNSGIITINNLQALDFEVNPSFSLIIDVEDSGTPSNTTSENLTIALTDVNEAPVLAVISDQSGSENEELTFTAAATDVDLPANTLSFSLDTDAESNGMDINANTGVFTWTPNSDQSGNYVVEITVTDGSLTDSQSISITISNVLGLENVNVIEVYPNPTTDYVSVKSSLAKTIRILDMDGKEVLSESLVEKVDVSRLSNGVYVLKLEDAEGKLLSTNRIIKQ